MSIRRVTGFVLTVATFAFGAATAAAQSAADESAGRARPAAASNLDACPEAAHRMSDYAIGEWVGTVKLREADGSFTVDPSVRSEATLEPAIGGCALVERRAVYRDGRDPTRILTIRTYDPDGGRWRQLLISTRPVVLRFRGEVVDGNLRFVTERPGDEGLVRVTDRRVEGGGFDRIIEASSDGGESWVLEDVVEYRSP